MASGTDLLDIVNTIHGKGIGTGWGDYDVCQHIYAYVKGLTLDGEIFFNMESDEEYNPRKLSGEDIMSVLSEHLDEKIFYFDYEYIDFLGNHICLFDIDLNTMTGTMTV